MRHHPLVLMHLTQSRETGLGTMAAGQFDWGGLLPKSNGGARWLAQRGWQSRVECIGISQPNCETDRSSRYESRSK
jgi:hypothetical protein